MRKFIFIMAFVIIALPVEAKDIYIAQNAAGAANGTSCAAAYAVTFFNTSGNWGSGSSQIGPGTTVHLCGTFTGAVNTTMLTFQGSGSSGSPITLLFESGAVLTSPAWNVNGAIDINGQSHLLIDGGSPCGPGTSCSTTLTGTGIVENTQNGTNLTYKQASNLINEPAGATVNNIEIRNLLLLNAYGPRVANTTADEAAAAGSQALQLLYVGNNILVHDNTAIQCGNGCFGVAGTYTGNATNWQVYNNYAREACWFINLQDSHYGSGISAQASNLYVHDNDVADNDQYWDTNDYFHTDPIFLFGNPNGTDEGTYANAYVYNNYIHGALGFSSGFVSLSKTQSGPIYIFNNVMRPTSQATGVPSNVSCNAAWIWLAWDFLAANTAYNNTFDASAACGGVSPSPYNITATTSVINVAQPLTFENNVLFNVGGIATQTVNSATGSISASDYNVWYEVNPGNSQQAFKWLSQYYYYNTPCPNAYGEPSWTSAPSANTCGGTDVRPSAYDTHSSSANPNLSATDQLQSGSSAIGLGTNFYSICNGQPNPGLGALCYDKNGNARPSSGNWDAGAYNYGGSSRTGGTVQPPSGLNATVTTQ